MGKISKYFGISHFVPLFLLPLWRKLLCKKGYHVWDEVWSTGNDSGHYLVCDACELMVIIDKIDTRYVCK